MSIIPGETEETEEEFWPGEDRPVSKVDEDAERIRREKVELRKAGLARLMEQPWFREWLMEHLISLNTFGTSFGVHPAGFPDPNATFFHLGMKAAGESLWEQFDNVAPEIAALMRREARTPKP